MTERVVSLDGGKPVLLDLCEPHDKVFADVATLMERGATVGKSDRPSRSRKAASPDGTTEPRRSQNGRLIPPGSDRTDCVEPDCGYVSPTRSALGQHVKQKHGKKLSDYDWTP